MELTLETLRLEARKFALSETRHNQKSSLRTSVSECGNLTLNSINTSIYKGLNGIATACYAGFAITATTVFNSGKKSPTQPCPQRAYTPIKNMVVQKDG